MPDHPLRAVRVPDEALGLCALTRLLGGAWQLETGEGAAPLPPATGEKSARWLDTVAAEPLRWLWPGRLLAGKLNLLEGDPDVGKSLLVADLAARLTAGRPLPDQPPDATRPPANVVLLSAEDDPADTLRPRLEAAGGDPARVLAFESVLDKLGSRPPRLSDLEAVERVLEYAHAALVVVDPLTAYLPRTLKAGSDQDMRVLLTPLARIAATTGAAVLAVRHLSKLANGNPLYRGGGTIGIVGAARSALLLARDPQDPEGHRRILAPVKSNLGPPAPALAFHVEATPAGIPFIAWDGPVDTSAAALLGAAARPTAQQQARDFLLRFLADGPREAQVVLDAACAAGIPERTLNRAKAALAIPSRKTEAGWLWDLPAVAPFAAA